MVVAGVAGKARKRGHDADAEGFADDMGGNAKRAKTESARWGVFQQGTSSQPACQQQSACNAITIHQLDNNLLWRYLLTLCLGVCGSSCVIMHVTTAQYQ